jgi:hypothetical protein
MVANLQTKQSTRSGELTFANNGFNARRHSASSPKVKPSDNDILENKHLEGEKISRILRFSSGSRIVQGLADRIFACSRRENFFLAKDLHSADTGELHDGKGVLWACNSRICPSCVAKLSKRNRKISRYVFENEKVFVGERWFFLTFTMPDLLLKDFPLLVCRSIMNDAWRKFSRSAWFKKVIRGGMKSEEFTIGTFDQTHYHIHGLAVCSNRITSDKFYEARFKWTEALKFILKKRGILWECETGNKNFIPALFSFLWSKPKMSMFLTARNEAKFFGLASVRVERVPNKDRAIFELCKYFTKSESWSKIPPEQLADIATIERFPRMFETFGVCKETAKGMNSNQSEKPLTEPPDAEKEEVKESELLNNSAYLDKKKISVRNINQETNLSHAPPRKRPSWRVRCRILPRAEWLKSLEDEINSCREYRMKQLRHRFAFATFQTLDGQEF